MASLEWMAPTHHPAQELCKRANRSLSQALDELINSASLANGHSLDCGAVLNIDQDSAYLPDFMDLDWIDYIDWANLDMIESSPANE